MFDYIIVGGGSAGSVLAHRLSTPGANRVLLCEAGPDTPPGEEPKTILDTYPGQAYFDPRFHWTELKVRTQVVSHNNPGADRPPLRKYEQARVLGGGSSINGQMANRGAPHDYDEWEERGAAGWNWDACLPYFRKVERDLDFDNEWHGQTGRIPVRRIPESQWPAHSKAAAAAFRAAGFKALPDQNGFFEDGYFPLTVNVTETRVSAAIGYLDAATRQRANFTLSTDTQVMGLIFEGARCVGIRALVKGQEQEFRGREVILCTGAIHSPAHLMRAGIGPAAHLKDQGIAVIADRPGVGQGLMDHPAISLSCFIKPEARLNRTDLRRHMLVGLRFSSGIEGAPEGDMFMSVASKSAWHAVGEQVGSMLTWVNKTYSQRGQVRLVGTDWRTHPDVEFNLLSDRRDLDRLMIGFKLAAALNLSAPVAAVSADPFPAFYSDRVRRIGVVNTKNRILTSIIAKFLDGPAALRRAFIDRFVIEGFRFKEVMEDDDALEDFIRKGTIGVWHASCSCRMGSDGDPMAVVDPAGRVRGVQGLRVVDASVFPVVPSANTNFPTLMTAEKMADHILADAG